MSMKFPMTLSGNESGCRAVPQTTAPPRGVKKFQVCHYSSIYSYICASIKLVE